MHRLFLQVTFTSKDRKFGVDSRRGGEKDSSLTGLINVNKWRTGRDHVSALRPPTVILTLHIYLNSPYNNNKEGRKTEGARERERRRNVAAYRAEIQ